MQQSNRILSKLYQSAFPAKAGISNNSADPRFRGGNNNIKTRYYLDSNSQSGAMLLYILLGVALFGALYFTFSKSQGPSSSLASKGSAKTAASQIIEYSQQLEASVQKILSSGYSEGQITFNSVNGPLYDVAQCPDTGCKVYNKIPYMIPDVKWLDTSQSASSRYKEWFATAQTCVPGIGTGGSGCQSDPNSAKDLIVFLLYLKKDICMEINKSLNIPNNSDDAPTFSGGSAFHTTYQRFAGGFVGTSGKVTPAIARASSGCLKSLSSTPPSGTYFYYKVLLAR